MTLLTAESPGGFRSSVLSLWMPNRYCPPSFRQYLVVPKYSSHRPLIFTLDPTLTGTPTRIQAPEGDLSSIFAVES